jgi:hypothetical protein
MRFGAVAFEELESCPRRLDKTLRRQMAVGQ